MTCCIFDIIDNIKYNKIQWKIFHNQKILIQEIATEIIIIICPSVDRYDKTRSMMS